MRQSTRYASVALDRHREDSSGNTANNSSTWRALVLINAVILPYPCVSITVMHYSISNKKNDRSNHYAATVTPLQMRPSAIIHTTDTRFGITHTS